MPATDTFWRNLKTEHVIFAVSSVALFGTTVWMIADDHSASWRGYQETFTAIEAEQTRREEKELRRARKDHIQELEARLEQAEKKLAEKRPVIAEVRSKVEELQFQVDLTSREVKLRRAVRDKVRADYDLAVRDDLPAAEQQRLLARFEAEQKKVQELQQRLEKQETALEEAQQRLDRLTAERTEVREELDRVRSDIQRTEDTLEKVDPDSVAVALKREVMTWPVIDGFNSPQQIQNDWLPNLDIKLGMAETDRFDRCRTCHQGIASIKPGNVPAFPHGEVESSSPADWVEQNKFPHPYSTHPNPDLYVTAASAHPATSGSTKFGCTICHNGQGSGTEFSNASHTPNDPHQLQQWHEEYGYEPNHFWEYPMHPERFVESSCIRCHHEVVELGVHPEHGATAPKVYKGYQLVKEYGCFGCHEIRGYEGAQSVGPDLRLEPGTPEARRKAAEDPNTIPGRMRKVGPSLEHVAAKTTTEWLSYWIEEPKRFRPDTRMPQFFHLSNQQDSLAEEYMPVELAGLARYLVDHSEPLQLDEPPENYQPDAERGKRLFSQRGCLACHSHEAFPELSAEFGPDLTQVHAKVKPPENGEEWTPQSDGFRWLYTWLREPTRYHPRTTMPNLYLDPYSETVTQTVMENGQEVEKEVPQTIDPAADIAAFLLQDGPREYEGIELHPYLGLVFDPDLTAEEARRLLLSEVQGVRVEEVVEGGPATQAVRLTDGQEVPTSLRRDDVLLSYNGTAVQSSQQLSDLIRQSQVGQPVSLTIWRDGAEQNVRITVGQALDDLARLHLSKALRSALVDPVLEGEPYPLGRAPAITGDEVELVYPGTVVSVEDPTTFHVKLDREPADLGENPRLQWSSGQLKGQSFPVAGYDAETGVLTLEADAFAGLPEEQHPVPAEDDEFMINGPVTRRMKLNYVGRRTISRYGCYGCHDIPGFEEARPIGTTLQGWGRKDTSKLAFEHVEEFLHHHGEPFFGTHPAADDQKPGVRLERVASGSPAAQAGLRQGDRILAVGEAQIHNLGDLEEAVHHHEPGERVDVTVQRAGQSAPRTLSVELETGTHGRVIRAMKKMQAGGAESGEFDSQSEQEREMSAAFFYRSLEHHDRAGFLWQKLRQPRSYDFKKIETKGYDERLRMPRFPFDEKQIEAIATFILGLVADPPAEEYIYSPGPREAARVEGERLLTKFNCVGCHMMDLPKIHYGTNLDDVRATRIQPGDHPEGVELLKKIKPPRNPGVYAGEVTRSIVGDQVPVGFDGGGPDQLGEKPVLIWRGGEQSGQQVSVDSYNPATRIVTLSESPDPAPAPGTRFVLAADTVAVEQEGETQRLPAMNFHGLVVAEPDPQDPPEFQFYAFDLWETLQVGEKELLPSERMVVSPATKLEQIEPARGGDFAEWLVEGLMQSRTDGNRALAWQMAPPPLYEEGKKVQPQWLYQFLREPQRLRQTTVLRMPRFNMDRSEARSLADYFAAVDDEPYPYQQVPQREPEYLAEKNRELQSRFGVTEGDYLTESWKLLNAPLCIGCHSLGGRQFQESDDPNQVQGPHLKYAAERLQPDWTLLWLYKPKWITPYTSMPQPFSADPNQAKFEELFGGDGTAQSMAIRDALMNYHRLMEENGKLIYTPPDADQSAEAAGAQ